VGELGSDDFHREPTGQGVREGLRAKNYRGCAQDEDL